MEVRLYHWLHTFNPLALLMALRGLSTLSTLRIFTTEMALDLHITHEPKTVSKVLNQDKQQHYIFNRVI